MHICTKKCKSNKGPSDICYMTYATVKSEAPRTIDILQTRVKDKNLCEYIRGLINHKQNLGENIQRIFYHAMRIAERDYEEKSPHSTETIDKIFDEYKKVVFHA